MQLPQTPFQGSGSRLHLPLPNYQHDGNKRVADSWAEVRIGGIKADIHGIEADYLVISVMW